MKYLKLEWLSKNDVEKIKEDHQQAIEEHEQAVALHSIDLHDYDKKIQAIKYCNVGLQGKFMQKITRLKNLNTINDLKERHDDIMQGIQAITISS